MSFSDIPSDILSRITHYSPLQSIARLCQVSRRVSEYVRLDKRLWLECLQRDVISKGIELPRYCQTLEQASAEHIRSWVRTAITLNKAYASGGQNAKVNSFDVDDGLLEATWTKIIRGRWFLVALSNVSISFVGIWHMNSNGSLELGRKFYLPGPVPDGVVDDVAEEIRIAITVATTNPYVQILALGTKDGKICLVPVQRLERARHVLLLREFSVGYRALGGDNTYPLLTDWRSGATVRLHPAVYTHHPNELLGNIHSPCHAMGVWRNCLFLVFDCSIEIFSSTIEVFALGSAYHGCQSLSLPLLRMDKCGSWIGEACIYEVNRIVLNTTNQSLRLSIRDRTGNQYIRAIVQRQDGSFVWDTDFPFFQEPEFVKRMTHRHCVGASSEYQLRLVSESIPIYYPAALELTRHPRSNVAETGLSSQFGDRQTFIVSTYSLPILDLTTAMDFDDGAGVILLGSCRGEISIIQFVDRSSHVPGSVLDDLPTMKYDAPDLETSPVSMILPRCYYFPDEIYEGHVPATVLEEAISKWGNIPEFNLPPGWSSDWTRHMSIQNWVLPFARWRTLEVDRVSDDVDGAHETWNRVIQSRLGHCDIVPIMYYEGNHDFIVFRVADTSRIYCFLRGPPLIEDEHIIRPLPYSVQDFSNPDVMGQLWRHRWRRGPLRTLREDFAADMLLGRNQAYSTLLDHLKTDTDRRELLDRSLPDDLLTWPLEDRRKVLEKARDWWNATHKLLNSREDDMDEF